MTDETQTTPVLEIEGLTVELDGKTLVEGVDLRLEAGQLGALVGPNGSGKTTILRSILGQLPHRGSIRLRLRDTERGLGHVPQNPAFDPSLPVTVADLFGLSTPGLPLFLRPFFPSQRLPATMDELLEKVGAGGFGPRLLGQLSGGELRRVLLARALVGDPELLLLDEPASNLDDEGAERFDRLLIELPRQPTDDDPGLTLLTVAHGRPRLVEAADRVFQLEPPNRSSAQGDPRQRTEPDRTLELQ